ncbi:MAG: hypothetical protein HHJ09_15335 [Glaciimonas sp.]|nr:hypothetical protein [Glaciimonas sp.]
MTIKPQILSKFITPHQKPCPKVALITALARNEYGAYTSKLLRQKGDVAHGIQHRTVLRNTRRIDHLFKDLQNTQDRCHLPRI